MASILTNSSSMAALSTLRSISNQMSTTQERISSGLKVGSASDNAAYWSIATTMKTESSSLGVVGETLGMGASIADTASMATQSVLENLKQLRDRVTAAGDPTNDKAKILTELNEIGSQMDASVKGANFNGVNWLTAKSSNGTDLAGSTQVLSGITRGVLDFITVTLDSTAITAVAAVPGPPAVPGTPALAASNVQEIVDTVKSFTAANLASSSDVQNTLAKLDVAIKATTELGAKFGAVSSRIDAQKEYISSLTDAIDRGVGSLVDADMNEESTRLKALQTQQQLAVQALSIANSSSESILQLFR